MGLTEVAAGTWRLESMVGPRNRTGRARIKRAGERPPRYALP